MRIVRTSILVLTLVAPQAEAGQAELPSLESKSAMSSTDDVKAAAPALAGYTEAILLGDLWKRTDLSPRDRSIVTVASLIAAGHMAQLPAYLERALDNGVTPVELSEIATHLAFYTGWPNSMSAAAAEKAVFARRGVVVATPDAGARDALTPDPMSEEQRIAAVEDALGGVAPALRDYTNGVLFGDLWLRPQLSPRDRSLVTVTALVTGGKTTQLVGHLNRALDNGLTKAEAGAVITHLAFYAGWPAAMSAASVARAVFDKHDG